jgi:hypothetical protein
MRRTPRSVSIAPPKARHWTECARPGSSLAALTPPSVRDLSLEPAERRVAHDEPTLIGPSTGRDAGRWALKNFTVLNTVLIFGLERRGSRKSLKLLARPKRFELLTPRFVV